MTTEDKKLLEISEGTVKFSLDSVRKEVLTFGTRIQEYLAKAGAVVEDYKFSVNEQADGLEVEVRLKAHTRP